MSKSLYIKRIFLDVFCVYFLFSIQINVCLMMRRFAQLCKDSVCTLEIVFLFSVIIGPLWFYFIYKAISKKYSIIISMHKMALSISLILQKYSITISLHKMAISISLIVQKYSITISMHKMAGAFHFLGLAQQCYLIVSAWGRSSPIAQV